MTTILVVAGLLLLVVIAMFWLSKSSSRTELNADDLLAVLFLLALLDGE
jgi:hypothetical protein